ncbi:CcdB family protein [Massilia sp. W12]
MSEQQACLLETPKLAAVPRHVLKHCVANLSAQQASIQAALDRLFGGF